MPNRGYGPVLSLALACCAAPAAASSAIAFDSAGGAMTVRHPALYPETIEYDARRDRFLLGSFRDGGIYAVDRDGKASRLVDDPRLCSVLGIAVDAGRRRLWAVTGDLGSGTRPSAAGPKRLAAVGIYDLASGKAIAFADLGPLAEGPRLPNGIALDASGNAYVTDSFSPAIFKVDPAGEAKVFLRDGRFSGNGVNLNGIVVHPDGYLLAVKKSDGALFKVPLDRPDAFTRVALDKALVGGDGLALAGRNDLAVIANRVPDASADAAYALSSRDGWATAKVEAILPLGNVYPTTAAIREDSLYVVHSKLNGLIAAPRDGQAGLKENAVIRAIARIGPRPGVPAAAGAGVPAR